MAESASVPASDCSAILEAFRQWELAKGGGTNSASMKSSELEEVLRRLLGGALSEEQIGIILSQVGSSGDGHVCMVRLCNWLSGESLSPLGEAKQEPALPNETKAQAPPSTLSSTSSTAAATADASSRLEELESQLQALTKRMEEEHREVEALQKYLQRQPAQFSVGQYNILAGYMGNNTEPWFLYGVHMPEERRKAIFKLHGERLPDGKPANPGWPAYVRGVLSEEEQHEVERVNREIFGWENRKDKLLEVIRDMDSDLLSLVECDHYEEFFKPGLAAMGYDSVWKQRPRPASLDGCCIAWRRNTFELVAQDNIEYADKYDPVRKRTFKDRIALMTLLRVRITGDCVVFVSTHLARNPEQPEVDRLRARQIGQVVRALAEFAKKNGVPDAPVLLTGDLNATSFGKLRGIASAIALLRADTFVHPFTFDCIDVPTGPTSVTTARNMRIDALLYQSQRLELVDVTKVPSLSTDDPIPNKDHPSDHCPISAKFRMKTSLQIARHNAQEWFLGCTGRDSSMPLNQKQLKEAFELYEHDGDGVLSLSNFTKAIRQIMGPGVASDADIAKIAEHMSADGIDLKAFCVLYCTARAKAGMPGLEEFMEAFASFDKDGSGELDQKEVLALFADCSPVTVPEDEIIQLFKEIDQSGDGLIQAKEFVDHLSRVWSTSISGQSPAPSPRHGP
mmetsp:Transcript_79549/g.170526  ORF Transcript_79549/g.170526 Transcript_79549/m.170526 type:complete len:681 (-) Transcript_79549:33-2075(-)